MAGVPRRPIAHGFGGVKHGDSGAAAEPMFHVKHSAADRVARAAAAYVGTPWLRGGRTRRGLDCLGLVLLAAGDAGIVLPDPKAPGANWSGWRGFVERLPDGVAAAAGDLAVLSGSGRVADHVGIVAMDRRSFWHATETAGVARTLLRGQPVLGYRRFRSP